MTTEKGELEVTPRALTVQADNRSIEYPADRPDASSLTWTLTDGALTGETPAYSGHPGYDSSLGADPLAPDTYTGAIVAGTLALSDNGAFKASNYTLTVTPGTLTVTNGTFDVRLTGGSWTYDGNPHAATLDDTLSGDTITYYVSDGAGGWTQVPGMPTVTDVADGVVTVKVKVDRPGYTSVEKTATIEITPATMGVDASGYTDKYDGDPHGITVTPLVTGSVVRYSETYSTDPAAYTETTSPTATDYTTGKTVYYAVTNPNYVTVLGSETIVITALELKVETGTKSQTYTGLPLTDESWTWTRAATRSLARMISTLRRATGRSRTWARRRTGLRTRSRRARIRTTTR